MSIQRQNLLLKVSEKLRLCRTTGICLKCSNCGHEHRYRTKCMIRICPKDYDALFTRTRSRLERGLGPWRYCTLWTLTSPSESYSLKDGKRILSIKFKALLRALKKRGYNVRNWIWVYEVTYNQELKRWNHHLHVVLDSRFIPHSLVNRLWGAHVWVSLRCTKRGSASYIAKYVSKGTHLSLEQYVDAFFGKRWFAGSLDKKGTSRTMRECENCGSVGTLTFSSLLVYSFELWSSENCPSGAVFVPGG